MGRQHVCVDKAQLKAQLDSLVRITFNFPAKKLFYFVALGTDRCSRDRSSSFYLLHHNVFSFGDAITNKKKTMRRPCAKTKSDNVRLFKNF